MKKESAFVDFQRTIRNSWTFQRMTEDEQKTWLQIPFTASFGGIGGTYKQRMNAYNAVYDAFLIGIGYTGPFWREQPDSDTPPF